MDDERKKTRAGAILARRGRGTAAKAARRDGRRTTRGDAIRGAKTTTTTKT
jgi:hypothetical protein